MYYYRGESVSVVTSTIILLGYLINFVIGYIVTAISIKKDNLIIPYFVLGIGTVGMLFFTFYPFDRLIRMGSYEEYLKETIPYIWQDRNFIISAILIGIYFIVPFSFLVKKNLDELKNS